MLLGVAAFKVIVTGWPLRQNRLHPFRLLFVDLGKNEPYRGRGKSSFQFLKSLVMLFSPDEQSFVILSF